MSVQISLCLLSIIATILFLVVQVKNGGVWGLLTKIFSSLTFIIYAIFSLTQITWFNQGSAFILVGLVCGLVADILLGLKLLNSEQENIYLNAGMVAFGVGHIFNLLGTILISSQVVNLLLPILISVAVALVLTPVVILVYKKFGANFNKFLWQVAVYLFVVIFMSSFSFYLAFLQLEFIVLAGGLTLFMLSTLVFVAQWFTERKTDAFFTIVSHVLYYAGQLLVATFLYLF